MAHSLAIHDLDAGYGAVKALRGVTLNVEAGETVALLGTNGNGKSTLMKCVAGLVRPQRGGISLTIDGTAHDLAKLSPEAIVDLGVALVPEGRRLFPKLTVLENLMLGAFRRAARRDIKLNLALAFETFPTLKERQNQLAGTMSGGQQQMLALAITLLHDPDVLLIDELSLGLSPIVVQELLGVVDRLKRDGMTIVIVEQSLNVALSISDRAIFLEKGRVRFEGPADELAARDDLARAVFLGTEGG